MTSWRPHIIAVAAVAAMAASIAPAANVGPWWNNDWQYRREVTVPVIPQSKAPGDEVALLTMPTGGLIKADGSDIRVIAGEQIVPHRVLMVGPGDQVTIAFAAYRNVVTQFVYFGNQGADAVKPLEILRGVLMETWTYEGAPPEKLKDIETVFQSDRNLLGRGFRPAIYQGHNPFGPQINIISRFTGHFLAPSGGIYSFASSSRNTSFLFIDEKLVAHQGERGEPARHPKAQIVELKAGPHKIVVYHVNAGGDPIVAAAWKPPGQENLSIMPREVFTPVATAQPGAMKKVGVDKDLDFLPEWAGECFVQDRYFQRYQFRAVTVGRLGQNVLWTWDFGDGQVLHQADAQHVYLADGDYTVTLTARTSLGEWKRTNRIHVSRPWDSVIEGKIEPEKRAAKVVGDYNFARLSPDANTQAVRLLDRAAMYPEMQNAAAAFVVRPQATPEMINLVIPPYVESLLRDKKAPKAVEALLAAARMNSNATNAAEMLNWAGQVRLHRLGDSDGAFALFTEVTEKYMGLTPSPAIQSSRIGLGDVWRLRGDYQKAHAAYDAATTRRDIAPERAVVLRGDFARQVEDYMRRQEFPTAHAKLDEWQKTFPLDKLDGYWSLLRVKLLQQEQRYDEAAGEAEALVKTNPASAYAAELLMQAAEAYRKVGADEKAKALWKQVVQKYPESPLSVEAGKNLK